MSELKSNKIATNDANNVSMDNALKLKSYTTTEMNALTSVAGDTIYNTTKSAPYYYNGSSWKVMKDLPTLTIDYLIIAGGGGGGGGFQDGAVGGGNGGSGVVILRYPNDFTITVGGGLTSSTTTSGTSKITTFTAGTDNVSFAL